MDEQLVCAAPRIVSDFPARKLLKNQSEPQLLPVDKLKHAVPPKARLSVKVPYE